MFFKNQAKWSSCEIDYLKDHHQESLNQLSGYLGKSVAAVKRKIDEVVHGKVPKTYGKSGKKTNIGKRADLDLFCRSSWEANVLRYLKSVNKPFLYEPKTFSFLEHGIKHGTVSYTPDILLPDENGKEIWLEIKGFLKTDDKTKIRRFKKFFPEEFAKLQAIVGSENTKAALFFKELGVPIYCYYNDLNKQYKKTIPNWE